MFRTSKGLAPAWIPLATAMKHDASKRKESQGHSSVDMTEDGYFCLKCDGISPKIPALGIKGIFTDVSNDVVTNHDKTNLIAETRQPSIMNLDITSLNTKFNPGVSDISFEETQERALDFKKMNDKHDAKAGNLLDKYSKASFESRRANQNKSEYKKESKKIEKALQKMFAAGSVYGQFVCPVTDDGLIAAGHVNICFALVGGDVCDIEKAESDASYVNDPDSSSSSSSSDSSSSDSDDNSKAKKGRIKISVNRPLPAAQRKSLQISTSKPSMTSPDKKAQ
jgi:hypothetical protein